MVCTGSYLRDHWSGAESNIRNRIHLRQPSVVGIYLAIVIVAPTPILAATIDCGGVITAERGTSE
jgi:hypothetical protein